MQASQDGDRGGPDGTEPGPAEGFLENPDGVVRLYRGGSVVAKCYGVRDDYFEGTYLLDGGAYQVEWRRWNVSRLVWSQPSALLFLQGATLQQLLQPLLILAGTPRPSSSPEPGMDGLVLAEVCASSSDLTYPQLFQLLAPHARGA